MKYFKKKAFIYERAGKLTENNNQVKPSQWRAVPSTSPVAITVSLVHSTSIESELASRAIDVMYDKKQYYEQRASQQPVNS